MNDHLRNAAIKAGTEAAVAAGWKYTEARDVVPRVLDAADVALSAIADPSLEERVADLELDNEGLTKLLDAHVRVAVMSRRGYVLCERPVETPDGVGKQDVWVRWSGRNAVDVVGAGEFDRDVVDEIAATVEEAPRAS